jgi:hypothetical protein
LEYPYEFGNGPLSEKIDIFFICSCEKWNFHLTVEIEEECEVEEVEMSLTRKREIDADIGWQDTNLDNSTSPTTFILLLGTEVSVASYKES